MQKSGSVKGEYVEITRREEKCLKIRAEISELFVLETVRKRWTMLRLRMEGISIIEAQKSERHEHSKAEQLL